MIDEELCRKYFKYKHEMEEVKKKLEKYKSILKRKLKEQQLTKYDTDHYSLHLYNAKKETINKKKTPETIWNQYKQITDYQILSVKEKKK